VKLATNKSSREWPWHAGMAEKVFKVRGQRSKVKVIARLNALLRRSLNFDGLASRLNRFK